MVSWFFQVCTAFIMVELCGLFLQVLVHVSHSGAYGKPTYILGLFWFMFPYFDSIIVVSGSKLDDMTDAS